MLSLILSLSIAQLSPTPSTRTIAQHGPDWSYTLSFTNLTPNPLTISPADLAIHISSPGLSNSRAGIPGQPAAHAVPMPAAHTLDGYGGTSVVLLRGSPDAAGKCQEKANIAVWADTAEAVAGMEKIIPDVGPPAPTVPLAAPPDDGSAPRLPVTVGGGGRLNIRVILKHDHEGNDGLDPLLGKREVVVKIGGPAGWTYKDVLDLSREQYFHLPDRDWSPMDKIASDNDHFDTLDYFSAPSALILDASQPGCQYFRFPERKVRGGVRMKLSFRYFVMPGSDGEPKVRLAQYRETPNQWRVLSEGGFERELPKPGEPKAVRGGMLDDRAAGRWREFVEVFVTQPECTTAALDFRIAGAEFGLVWVDDVVLEYVDTAVHVGGGTTGRNHP